MSYRIWNIAHFALCLNFRFMSGFDTLSGFISGKKW
jgi:hypothetical protein